MKVVTGFCAALLVLALPLTAQAKLTSRHGVTIISCVVNSNGGSLTNGVNIVYYNTHETPATEVTW